MPIEGLSRLIGSWYCVPEDELTVEALREYARAGFTHFQTLHGADGHWRPYSRAGNLVALSLCAEVGLRCFVVDDRIYRAERPYPTSDPVTDQDILAAVADYQTLPSLAGYLVYDEPSPDAFDSIARVARELRRLDPEHVPLAPLFPMHTDARFPDNFAGLTYSQYVEAFARSFEPTELAFDYYPFFDPDQRARQYVENFTIVSQIAQSRGIPFWYYAGITRPPGAERPTPSRVRVQVALALAHGARGIFHYTYRAPPGDTDAPITADGRRDDDAWSAIRVINAEIGSFLAATRGWTWLGAAHDDGRGSAGRIAELPVHVGGGGAVGLFGREGSRLAYVVNRDVESWRSIRSLIGGISRTVELPPGAGRLIAIR